MRKIYYEAGPPELKAGIAGRFVAGKYKPVSDKVAEMLLKKEGFKEAGEGIPPDDSENIADLEAAAVEADKVDAKAATKEAKDSAKNSGKPKED